MTKSPACPICAGSTREAFRATVLRIHEASYRHCPDCGYLYADRPYWLKQAYSSAIASADTGLVARNLEISDKLNAVLCAFFDIHGRFLDLAGGTGLLVRLMRDIGFDYFWEDSYCANIHAVGFDARPEEHDFEAATAFEAIEHMEDPLAFVADALARTRTRTLIFSTELHDGTPPPGDWWYYAFATGQHIAFFSRKTLEQIGQRLKCRLVSYRGMHVLSAQSISEWKYRFVLRYLRGSYRRRVRRALTGRMDSDHQAMLGGEKAN